MGETQRCRNNGVHQDHITLGHWLCGAMQKRCLQRRAVKDGADGVYMLEE